MADKSSFTPVEWNTLLGAPMLAGMAVTLAEPNGLWGMLKEGMAGARSLLEAKQDAGASPLIKALVADMETSEGRGDAKDAFKAQLTGKSAAELKPQVIAALAKIGTRAGSEKPLERLIDREKKKKPGARDPVLLRIADDAMSMVKAR